MNKAIKRFIKETEEPFKIIESELDNLKKKINKL